ncbi:hypothetical protein [uncultured Thiodictyon sp.]|jgi:hypothetical protein|uniref:hypothetical protein n=1 Tax=uncultured Thiodictyon sp. TaxID=1846217 RepID=UPI0025E1F906|nr:hypothetical protein [uncultured Thiodictyon sp.]
MIDRLREVLFQRRSEVLAEGADQCPSPSTLANLSRLLRVSGENDYQRLAWHIMGCLKCARRWELLQSDPHLHIMEILAVARNTLAPGDEAEMLRLRVRTHVDACADCRSKQQPAKSAPSAWDQGVLEWFAPRLVAAYRGDPMQVEAIVLDREERVQLTEGASLTCKPVQLQVYRDRRQRLGVAIAGIQPAFKCARVLLCDSAVTQSPWADVNDGKASIGFGVSQATGLEFVGDQLTVLLKP